MKEARVGRGGEVETVTTKGLGHLIGSRGTRMALWNGPELRKEIWPFSNCINQPLDPGCAPAVGMALDEYRARLWKEI